MAVVGTAGAGTAAVGTEVAGMEAASATEAGMATGVTTAIADTVIPIIRATPVTLITASACSSGR